MAMRYHWGLGIGHTYSHGRDVYSQQGPTTSDLSDSSVQAFDASRGAGDGEKQNDSDEHLPVKASEPQDAGDAGDEHLATEREDVEDVGDERLPVTQTIELEDTADSDASTTDDSDEDGSSCDEQEGDCDSGDLQVEEESLELYHTYHSE